MALGNRGKWVGTVQEVLVEEDGFGRTRGNARVAVEGASRVGETVRVRIRNSEKTTFDGEVIGA
jgi:tRNA A37 methylthiotransferase MiaB